MLLIFIRTIIIFLITFLIIRLMGKRQIGEMQPFEFVITLLVADLACIPMADLSIPLGYGFIAILTVFILHQILTIIEKKSVFLGRIISSKPSMIIDRNGIVFSELKKLNISVNELQEILRNSGYSNFDEVAYAIVETNGKFSILENTDKEQDEKPEKTPLPICLIEEGKYKDWEMQKLMIDRDNFENILKRQGVKNIKDVLVATYDNNGKLYYQCKNMKFKVANIGFIGEKKW